MEHTPIPWTIQEASKGPDRDYGIMANGGVIAEVFEHGGSEYEICVDAEANAAFIVRAVNNHAKLLKALEAVVAAVAPTTLGTNELSMIFRQARATIEEATK